MGEGVIRIDLNRLSKIIDSLLHLRLGLIAITTLVKVIYPLYIKIVSGRRRCICFTQGLLFGRIKLQLQSHSDLPCNSVLDHKDVRCIRIKTVCPKRYAITRAQQVKTDTQTFAGTLNRSLENRLSA